LGYVGFSAEEGLHFDVERGLPAIEAAYVGIKSVSSGAAVAQIGVGLGAQREGVGRT